MSYLSLKDQLTARKVYGHEPSVADIWSQRFGSGLAPFVDHCAHAKVLMGENAASRNITRLTAIFSSGVAVFSVTTTENAIGVEISVDLKRDDANTKVNFSAIPDTMTGGSGPIYAPTDHVFKTKQPEFKARILAAIINNEDRLFLRPWKGPVVFTLSAPVPDGTQASLELITLANSNINDL